MARLDLLRDEVLADDIREMLSEHRTLHVCEVNVGVRGGVAHVDGTVPSASDIGALRTAIGRVRGINAVWDRLRLPDQECLRIVDLGCGNCKQYSESIGVDRFAHGAVDIVTDLEDGLPFLSESVDQVFAVHFLEHVRNLLALMNEVHRVLKPGGVLHVMVPNWRCVNAVADPTHVRFFDVQTFKFFCRPYPDSCSFRPLSVSSTAADLFADLQPVKAHSDGPVTDEMLCRYFD